MPAPKNRVRPILLLEMNEVPWRVVDKVLAEPSRWPNVKRFFSRARTHTTISHDRGELSPWVTWPSLHRGMDNTEHNVLHLGQDVSTFRGVPIWDEYRKRGLSVGVCGSMQSWPPVDPGKGGFYVPDTFAHDAQCIPAYVEPIQQFNLDLVRRNGRVVKRAYPSPRSMLKLASSLVRTRFRPRTALRLARQLAAERRDPTKVARRPVFQTVMFWDVFRSLFDAGTPPALSTFFTNHVAGVMHRYWDHVFPSDFGRTSKGPHADTMDFALDLADEMLGDALRWQAENPELIVVMATSMGQQAIHREHEGYAGSITDVAALLARVGVAKEQFTPLLAMVPQVAVEIHDAEVRARVKRELEAAKSMPSGLGLLVVEEIGASSSITLVTPRVKDIREGGVAFASEPSRVISWADAGITMHELEAGTAYHIPEGVLAIVGDGVGANDARTPIDLTNVKAMLMELGGVERRSAEPRASVSSSAE